MRMGNRFDALRLAAAGVDVIAVVSGKVDPRRAFYADNLEIF